VEKFLPEKFWNEEYDDAKPESLSARIGVDEDGQPREYIERDKGKIEDYEKIERSRLRPSLSALYKARSNLVHCGEPLPTSIVVGLHDRIPAEAVQELLQKALGIKSKDRVPTLLTLERLVAYCLVEFLSHSRDESSMKELNDA